MRGETGLRKEMSGNFGVDNYKRFIRKRVTEGVAGVDEGGKRHGAVVEADGKRYDAAGCGSSAAKSNAAEKAAECG